MVRAGRSGEREDFALSEGLAVIGWEELPDLSTIDSREELKALCDETYPNENVNKINNWVGQLWAFRERIKEGDLVALPLKKRSAIAVGKVTGPYHYRSDTPSLVRHIRSVEWIKEDIPRSNFDQDLLYSFGAFMTVCRIQRNNAEQRVRALLSGRPSQVRPMLSTSDEDEGASDTAALPDLEEYGRDQIRNYLGQKFKGHELTRLVNVLLETQGYQTQMSPPGADGGVDIIAGRGPLGFDPPRICVQVKSSDQPVDVKVLRELQGVLKSFGADQGLFVSWGGFRQSVFGEARRLFFEVRLWDAGDLVDGLLDNYDRLPEGLRAELPLKRIWTLVPEE
jgi:restriction system protein